MLFAQSHGAVLGVTWRDILLREILVIESDEGDIVGADVEKHQFFLQEGVFCEFSWEVKD